MSCIILFTQLSISKNPLREIRIHKKDSENLRQRFTVQNTTAVKKCLNHITFWLLSTTPHRCLGGPSQTMVTGFCVQSPFPSKTGPCAYLLNNRYRACLYCFWKKKNHPVRLLNLGFLDIFINFLDFLPNFPPNIFPLLMPI